MKSTEKPSNILTGVAGEYFVAAELSRMGHIASVTLRNTRGIDILCSNADSSKQVSIQVKTRFSKGHSWQMHKKDEEFFSAKHFYVFVSLNGGNPPDFYIVPSKTVANFLKTSHRKWMKKPSRTGKKHKSTDRRKFRDSEKEYLDRWDLLKLQT